MFSRWCSRGWVIGTSLPIQPALSDRVVQRPLTELAQPFHLGGIRPDDPASETAWLLPGPHPAALDPGVKGAGRDAERVGQLGPPPLVRAEPGAGMPPGAMPAQPQLLAQHADGLHPEPLAARRPVALGVQSL